MHGPVCAIACIPPSVAAPERTISVEGGVDAALADKLIEIAGKCPVHRTLEAGAAAVTKVAGKSAFRLD